MSGLENKDVILDTIADVAAADKKGKINFLNSYN
jgi:hypothetical protein